MSLNKYEQPLFDYIDRQVDERRYWHGKIQEATRISGDFRALARELEREMWEYYRERSQQVPILRDLNTGGLQRVSLLNLTEYLLRVWGPSPKPKKPGPPVAGSSE